MSDHARLSPSGASRWTTCLAAPRLEEGVESKDSVYSLQGTAAHKLLEDLLLGTIEPGVIAPGIEILGVSLNADDIAAVLEAHKYIMNAAAGAAFLYAEMRVDPGILMQRNDCWGTLDCIIGHPDGAIEVIDYKHGAGVAVDVIDNKQLLLYAIGAYQFLTANAIAVTYVKTTIIQPRAHHASGTIRSDNMPSTALIATWLPYFKTCAEATDDPNVQPVPGKEQCRWCSVKATCPAIAGVALQGAQGGPTAALDQSPETRIADSFTQAPDALEPGQVAFILDHELLIKGWLTAVHEHAHDLLMAGKDIPGFKMVNGRKSKSWIGDGDDLLGKIANFSMIAEKGKTAHKIGKVRLQVQSMLSPAQVIKQIKPHVTKQTWEKIYECISVNQGKPVIAPLSDSRKAVTVKVEEMFDDLSQTEGTDGSEPEVPSYLL